MPAFSVGTALTIAALTAGGTAAVTHAVKKRKARNAAANATPESVLGPPPTAPAGALREQSDAIARAQAAASTMRRRPGRPVNAPTATPARGAQLGIRKAVTPTLSPAGAY